MAGAGAFPWLLRVPLGPDGRGGGSGLEPALNSKTSGTPDPVDTATGDDYSTSTDLTVPGAGFPLAFTKTYDAQSAQDEITAGASPGPLGYGWSYNLGESISYDPVSQVATLEEGNGAETTFDAYSSLTSPPAWCSSSGPNFCAPTPRTIATLNLAGGTWTLTNYINGKTTYSFNTSGALTQITNEQGDSITSSAGTPGAGSCPSSSASCTVWTSSASGRSLSLAFDAAGQLTQVADSATPTPNVASLCFYTQACAAGAPTGGGQSSDLYRGHRPWRSHNHIHLRCLEFDQQPPA